MRVLKFPNGVVAFEPAGNEDSVSSVSSMSLLDAGWSPELVELIKPKLLPYSEREHKNESEKPLGH